MPSADRAQSGLGIGLTLVRRLVELHGGTIEAASPGVGHGSSFTVRLLLVPPPRAVPARPEAASPDAKRRRVLVVEDNADERQLLRDLLGLAGHEVHEAADGPSGLDAALRLRPEIALIDIGLPGLDGYELARRVRAKQAPIGLIAVTGYGLPEDRRRAAEAGFDAHFVKPADPDSLTALITRL
jgi:CheY-like chemotaxis protein